MYFSQGCSRSGTCASEGERHNKGVPRIRGVNRGTILHLKGERVFEVGVWTFNRPNGRVRNRPAPFVRNRYFCGADLQVQLLAHPPRSSIASMRRRRRPRSRPSGVGRSASPLLRSHSGESFDAARLADPDAALHPLVLSVGRHQASASIRPASAAARTTSIPPPTID